MKTAQVSWFDQVRGFGVAKSGGGDIFIHVNQFCDLVEREEEIVFGKPSERQPYPTEGEEIVFGLVVGRGYGRWEAGCWTYKCDLDDIEREIAQRPTYRVSRNEIRNGELVGSSVVWEGYSLEKLEKIYPRPDDRWTQLDELRSKIDQGKGCEIHHSWEVKKAGGDWQPCKDPRIVCRSGSKSNGRVRPTGSSLAA